MRCSLHPTFVSAGRRVQEQKEHPEESCGVHHGQSQLLADLKAQKEKFGEGHSFALPVGRNQSFTQTLRRKMFQSFSGSQRMGYDYPASFPSVLSQGCEQNKDDTWNMNPSSNLEEINFIAAHCAAQLLMCLHITCVMLIAKHGEKTT